MISMKNKGYICIFITLIAFSSFEIAGKMIAGQINPFQMTFIRFMIGGLFLLPFAIKELRARKFVLTYKDYLFFALTGTIGIVISMSALQYGILFTKASIAAVIFSTNPIFTIPLACIILKEKLTMGKIISICISLVGIVFIFNPFGVNGDIKGMIFAFIAAVTFALYGIINKTRLARYGSTIINGFSFIIGSTLLLVGMLFFQIPVLEGISSHNIAHLLYLGIFVTGIGYLCYFAAMKYTSAITTSMVFFIKPALAPVLAFMILGEKITPHVFWGIICVIVAAAIMFVQNKGTSEKNSKPVVETLAES